MVELLAFLAAIATLIWTRKQDIVSGLDTPQYRNFICDHLTKPKNYYRHILRRALRFINKYLEHGPKTYFSLLFVSLIFNSLIFSIVWVFYGDTQFSRTPYIDESTVPWAINLIFIAAVLGVPACYYFSKYGHEFETFVSEKVFSVGSLGLRRALVRLMSTIIISLSILYYSNSIEFALSVFVFAFLQIFVAGEHMDEDGLLAEPSPLRLSISALFGPTALLAVVFSIVVGNASGAVNIVIPIVICVMSIISGTFAYIGAKISARPPGPNASADLLGRAPLYCRMFISMGVHIANNYTGFAIAVSIAAAVPAIINTFGLGTLSANIAILLTASIFVAGARTVAGSGLVIFVVIIFTSSILFAISPKDFFTTWAVPLMFWSILPVINSIFDAITWSISRMFANQIVSNNHSFAAFWIIMDVIASFLIICGLVAILTIALSSYMQWSLSAYGISNIDLEYLLYIAETKPLDEGLWITLMLISTIIPTVAHLVIVSSAGLGRAMPATWKRKLRFDVWSLENDRPSATKESIGWRLALFDRTTGFFVYAGLFYALAWVAYAAVSSLGSSLLFIARSVM